MLFLIIFFTIFVGIGNARLKLSPITVANDTIDMLPLFPNKAMKDLSK